MNCFVKCVFKCRGKIYIFQFSEMASQALRIGIGRFVRMFGKAKAFWKFQRNMNCRSRKYIRFSKAGSDPGFIILREKYNILLYNFTNAQYIVELRCWNRKGGVI